MNVRDLATDEKLLSQTDYGIFLIAQRVSEEKEDSESDDLPIIKYRLKVERIDNVINLKTNADIKFEKGKSPSQKQRFLIERELGKGEYPLFMGWIMGKLPNLIEDYKDK